MLVQRVTDSEFAHLLQTTPRLIVSYTASWCGSCRLFAPTYRRLSQQPEYADIMFLDVNSEENPIARRAAGVDNLPFFATFRNGVLVEGQATTREVVLKSMLDRLLE